MASLSCSRFTHAGGSSRTPPAGPAAAAQASSRASMPVYCVHGVQQGQKEESSSGMSENSG